MAHCEYLNRCEFFRKYGHKSSLAWQGLFTTYCRGELVTYCERWKAYRQGQAVPDEEIMPCGEVVPHAFTLLL